jgi:hydroxymethylglutaryl-CoA synthase
MLPNSIDLIDRTEKFDGVPAGKYTIGLGQQTMAYVGDREDINSMCLTVLHNLMEKYNIDPESIGRLEVGTETITDKSKATKTFLMDLFGSNTNIEGIDTKNACYGGTNALFNSIQWIESSAWDGRHAIVIAGDIAVYAKGNARSTGGAGAVAMLIGPNAPLVFERGLRHSHMEHAWDFYKPDKNVEYPTVDGQLSNTCYLKALDSCYRGYAKKFAKLNNGEAWTIEKADFVCFHSPYNKLVQKSFGRMLYNDFLSSPDRAEYKDAQRFLSLATEATYSDRELEGYFLKKSGPFYKSKVSDSAMLPQQLGNLYTGSLYSSLVSLLSTQTANLVGKRVLLFSYGSGLTATLFSLKVNSSIQHIADRIGLQKRLQERIASDPADYSVTMDLRAQRHLEKSYKPTDSIDPLFPGTYYLTEIDEKMRRKYARKPTTPLAKL